MSLFSKFSIKSLFAFLAVIMLISACTFSPVYSEKSQVAKFNLSYAKPNTRLEQIIYQDLTLRLGEKSDSHLLTIKVSNSTRAVARTSNGTPSSIREAILRANITLIDSNDSSNIVFSGIRKASASYSTNSQIIANNKALENANETAALELAQTIRLTLIGVLSANNISN